MPIVNLPASSELHFAFARASGPGGQNVNKVNSKAVLHWDLWQSKYLDEAQKQRFSRLFANRLNQRGEVVLQSSRHRDQQRNVDDCLEKLAAMITRVLTPPTVRRKTRPTQASKKKRVETKKRHALKKQRRHFVDHD